MKLIAADRGTAEPAELSKPAKPRVMTFLHHVTENTIRYITESSRRLIGLMTGHAIHKPKIIHFRESALVHYYECHRQTYEETGCH